MSPSRHSPGLRVGREVNLTLELGKCLDRGLLRSQHGRWNCTAEPSWAPLSEGCQETAFFNSCHCSNQPLRVKLPIKVNLNYK